VASMANYNALPDSWVTGAIGGTDQDFMPIENKRACIFKSLHPGPDQIRQNRPPIIL
jgi:hypothetical protein